MAKKEVEVALVANKFWNVEVALEVAVIQPTLIFGHVEEAVQVLAVARFKSPVNVEPRAAAAPNDNVLFGEVAPMVELAKSVLATVAQVAAPKAESDRTN